MIALALVAGPATLNYFQGPALFAAGRSGLAFWATLTGFLGNLIVAVISVGYGAIAVAAGFTLRAHITTPFSLRFVSKGIGVTPGRALLNILPPYLCALLMAPAVTFLLIDLLKAQSIFICLLFFILPGDLLFVVAMADRTGV